MFFLCEQGTRDVASIHEIIRCLVCGTMPSASSQHNSGASPDPEYIVHMGILTACLGKKVPVSARNIMVSTMEDALSRCPEDSVSVFERALRSDEVCVCVPYDLLLCCYQRLWHLVFTL